jgi:hypothetical protein
VVVNVYNQWYRNNNNNNNSSQSVLAEPHTTRYRQETSPTNSMLGAIVAKENVCQNKGEWESNTKNKIGMSFLWRTSERWMERNHATPPKESSRQFQFSLYALNDVLCAQQLLRRDKFSFKFVYTLNNGRNHSQT